MSLPADVRRRWQAERVLIDDRGDHLVVRPMPRDPVAAALGIFEGRIPPTEELRKIVRRDEESAASRRL